MLLPQLRLASQSSSVPANKTEEQVLELMNRYEKNVGGSGLSMMDIQNGLSLCYALFFLWTGILNIIMLRGLARNKRLLGQISLLNTAVLLVGAAISVRYFFWLPAASFGVAALLFLVAALSLRREF